MTRFYKSYVALATLEKATAPESYCFLSLNTHDKGILLTYLYPSEVQEVCRTGDSNANRLLIDQQLIPFSYR